MHEKHIFHTWEITEIVVAHEKRTGKSPFGAHLSTSSYPRMWDNPYSGAGRDFFADHLAHYHPAVPCIDLTRRHFVTCLCLKDGVVHVQRHRVGDYPHKEKAGAK